MKIQEVLQFNRIIFYDGDCGFCNTSVQLVLKKRKKDFYFIPLQSSIAEEIMTRFNETIEMNTLYLVENGLLYDRSTAAIRIAKHLRSLYPLLYYLGLLVPKFIRDSVYNQIAKRRHKIRPGFCALPSVDERKFFIQS
nr:DUF393 domain-containing protein [uncultured Brumimicrobium sp.]